MQHCITVHIGAIGALVLIDVLMFGADVLMFSVSDSFQ
jgi:hypothetical protein